MLLPSSTGSAKNKSSQFLSVSSSEVVRLELLEITSFIFFIFWSPDFHEFWQSVMGAIVITEIKQQWAVKVVGWVTV